MSEAVIVIPCFDEAARLDVERFQGFLASPSACRLIFVNDGSTDDTQCVLEGLVSEHPGQAEVIRLDRNRGKAEAVRRGMLAALESRAPYVGYWDADLATPLSVIGRFCEHLDRHPQHDVVTGARVQLLGRRIERRWLRHYTGRLSATAIAVVLGLQVYDTQCGAKLFRSGLVPMLFGAPFASEWIFDVEILARLVRDRAESGGPPPDQCIYEYALEEWQDVHGSKLGPTAYVRGLFDLLRIYLAYIRPIRSRVRATRRVRGSRGS